MEAKQAKKRFREADRLYQEGEFAEALDLLDELEHAFPNDRHVMFPRARCLGALGRTAEAVALCDQVIQRFHYAPAESLKAALLQSAPSPAMAPPGAFIPGMLPEGTMPTMENVDMAGVPSAPGMPDLDNTHGFDIPDVQSLNAPVGNLAVGQQAAPTRVNTGPNWTKVLVITGVVAAVLLVVLVAIPVFLLPGAASDMAAVSESEEPALEDVGSGVLRLGISLIALLLITDAVGVYIGIFLTLLIRDKFAEEFWMGMVHVAGGTAIIMVCQVIWGMTIGWPRLLPLIVITQIVYKFEIVDLLIYLFIAFAVKIGLLLLFIGSLGAAFSNLV